jgi:hypothetical protein
MPYLNSNTPVISAFIRNEYLFNHEKGFGEYTKCDIHAVASIESRTLLFEAFLENGVNWTRRPITAFCWKPDAPILPLEEHIYWDCFSYYIDVQVRHRLYNFKADLISISGQKRLGNYLYTIDWAHENTMMTNIGFAETNEHKCAHIFKGEDGNFFAYPNNKIIWYDRAFTENRISSNPGYIIDNKLYSVEDRTYYESDNMYQTNFNKNILK